MKNSRNKSKTMIKSAKRKYVYLYMCIYMYIAKHYSTLKLQRTLINQEKDEHSSRKISKDMKS